MDFSYRDFSNQVSKLNLNLKREALFFSRFVFTFQVCMAKQKQANNQNI